eukprot:TRINITY_DN8202_c0_g1_i1.p2 TRINITY_DN8202_c0_g1~~TRINITY_DN8202_c0_g1_i1.p2  ORF type:complete len:59 (+),score=6.08 TRINITY_DN8202_c0_g1_i1:190-366(+)
MSTYVTYNSTGEEPTQFKSTIFNETVTLVEAPSTADIKRIVHLFLIGCWSWLAYLHWC